MSFQNFNGIILADSNDFLFFGPLIKCFFSVLSNGFLICIIYLRIFKKVFKKHLNLLKMFLHLLIKSIKNYLNLFLNFSIKSI